MIPLATTSVSVLRRPADDPGVGEDDLDPYDAQPAREVIASGVRAHISAPSGSEQVAGGSQEVIDAKLGCDPTDLVHTDQILDATTGVTFDVVWVSERVGLGLDHLEAGLKRVAGVV